MRTLAVLTSGGDSPGMNAAIRAITKLAATHGVVVLGVEQGYDGLIDGRFRELTRVSGGVLMAAPELELVSGFGGTILGSARSARFTTPEGRAAAARQLVGCDGLVVIGGNGSLTGARLLGEEQAVRVVGLPASIDNDIGCTGLCIGVDTALNTIVDACDRISDTARAHRRAFVVEVMGRDCGYLAMASAVAAGADAVLFREQGRSTEELVDRVEQVIERGFSRGKQRVLVIKSEGVKLSTTELVSELSRRIAGRLAGVDVRATVLGHLVRGGNPSYQDRMIAGRLSLAAVEALLGGASSCMAAWQPVVKGGTPTQDPYVQTFSLDRVLEETRTLLDGTSDVTKRRVKMIEHVEGVLGV